MPSNASPEQERFDGFVRRMSKLDADAEHLRQERRALRREMKTAGVMLADFDYARRFAALPFEEREERLKAQWKYLDLLGCPVGTQGDLFEKPAPPATSQRQKLDARRAGMRAAKDGLSHLANPHGADHPLHRVWELGWQQQIAHPAKRGRPPGMRPRKKRAKPPPDEAMYPLDQIPGFLVPR